MQQPTPQTTAAELAPLLDTWSDDGRSQCRCCGASMGHSDHCWHCGCEEMEERCTDAQRLERRAALAGECAEAMETGWHGCRCGQHAEQDEA